MLKIIDEIWNLPTSMEQIQFNMARIGIMIDNLSENIKNLQSLESRLQRVESIIFDSDILYHKIKNIEKELKKLKNKDNESI